MLTLGSLLPSCALTTMLLVSAAHRMTAVVGVHPDPPRSVFLVPVPHDASWEDQLFLAAIPAASRVGDGRPLVLAIDPSDPWRPETLDFLARYHVERLYWVGGTPIAGAPDGVEVEHLEADSALSGACSLAARFWSRSKGVVLFAESDPGAALSASVLAARLDYPLLPWDGGVVGDATRDLIEELGVGRALFVGGEKRNMSALVGSLASTHLADGVAVARWLKHKGHALEYIAVANPLDVRFGAKPKHSLAAPLLASGRQGIVATLAYETRWKQKFSSEPSPAPGAESAASTGESVRRGTLEIGDLRVPFELNRDARSSQWVARLDSDADGKFESDGEGPFRTGESVEVDGRRWSVDLDVLEKQQGSALWLTYPTHGRIAEDLAPYFAVAGEELRFLCLVGWPESLPPAIVGDAQGIDADLVSDLSHADIDDDPFVDLAFGRVIAEDFYSATLLACRSLAYSDLLDPTWQDSFATAEWEQSCARSFEALGFESAGHHAGEAVIAADSPLTRAAVIVHGSHAAWTVMGATYAWDTSVLIAPSLVASSGCSTASLDQDPALRSVAARLLRNGAIAFVGNSRRGVAQGLYFDSEFMNAALAGATLGEANRHALNRVLVAVLDGGELETGLHRYQLYNTAFYGDPALALHRPSKPKVKPARVEQRGLRVTVRAPSEWWQYKVETLAEWNSEFGSLYLLRGAGLATDSRWEATEKRNQDDLWFTAEARTRRTIRGIDVLGEVAAPLGWTGKFYVDEHRDGSRSILWRCRLVDFDMRTGEFMAEADSLSFRLKTR